MAFSCPQASDKTDAGSCIRYKRADPSHSEWYPATPLACGQRLALASTAPPSTSMPDQSRFELKRRAGEKGDQHRPDEGLHIGEGPQRVNIAVLHSIVPEVNGEAHRYDPERGHGGPFGQGRLDPGLN